MTREVKVLIGIPGSGKSTWAKQEEKYIEADGLHAVIISRDQIRYAALKDGEDYFAHENATFAEFIRQINEAMQIGIDYVIVDASHISPQSRNKLLSRLKPDKHTNLCFEQFNTPIDICLERNAKRTGRERVPDSAIHNMQNGFTSMTLDQVPKNKWGFNGVKINYHYIKEED